MLKNTLLVVATIIGLSLNSTLIAGDKPVTVPVVVPNPVEHFSFEAKLFSAAVIQDTEDYAFGGGLAVAVNLWDGLSVEANGAIFENEVYTLGANLIYEFPVNSVFSVYALAGGVYDFETDQWAVPVGGGVKFNLNERTNIFADGSYNFLNSDKSDVTTVRLGIGFKF